MSWTVTDVQKEYLRQNILGQVRTHCRVSRLSLESGSTQRSAEQDLKKRKIGERDINQGGASSLTADAPNRGKSEQGSSAGNENLLAGCIAAVNKLLRAEITALSGKFAEDELKAGRELELQNMLNFDALE